MIYRSKLDWWLAAAVAGAATLMVGWGVIPLLRRQAWANAAVVIGTMLLVALLTCPICYRITDKELVVRSGIQRWRVPLAAITGVLPRTNFVASAALSVDRLEIEYKENGRTQSILVSPKDQDGFVFELATRVRGLRPFGFGLARPGWYRPEATKHARSAATTRGSAGRIGSIVPS